MEILLDPQTEDLIQSKIQEGKYSTPAEVIRQALQALEEKEQKDRVKIIMTQSHVGEKFIGEFKNAVKYSPTLSVADFFSSFQKQIHWDKEEEYELNNQSIFLGNLFLRLILPKETFFNQLPQILFTDKGHPYYSLNDPEWGTFDVWWNDGKAKTLPRFISRLRNSLVHRDNFKIIEKAGTEGNMVFLF